MGAAQSADAVLTFWDLFNLLGVNLLEFADSCVLEKRSFFWRLRAYIPDRHGSIRDCLQARAAAGCPYRWNFCPTVSFFNVAAHPRQVRMSQCSGLLSSYFHGLGVYSRGRGRPSWFVGVTLSLLL